MENAEEVVVRLVGNSIGQTGDKTLGDRAAFSDKPDGRVAGKQGVQKNHPQGAAAAKKLFTAQIDFTAYCLPQRRIERFHSLGKKHAEQEESQSENHHRFGFLREDLPQEDFKTNHDPAGAMK